MSLLKPALEFIGGINECITFFNWARSLWRGTQEQTLKDEVSLQLQSGLQRLRDTLPAKYDLIDRAEWRSHDSCVAQLLPKLKDAVYDADDLLDEFGWYEQKVALEDNPSQSAFVDFFGSVIQGSFDKVKDITERINNISSELEKLDQLRNVPRRFDRSLRPETSSFQHKAKIFGRDTELNKVMELLGVPKNAHSKRKRESNGSSTSTPACDQDIIPVLPIVGIGGVGKTTLAQHICNHTRVKSHFDLIIWTCVSDDFDVKRLTKQAIESSSKKGADTDHLDSLQRSLSEQVSNKRFLIILDDMWEDALSANKQWWESFCAPLRNGLQGSMMLVTTRSSQVAHGVGTMEQFTLDGLKDNFFWDFFKLCAFGSLSSNTDRDLEEIGRSILPKLKGSPLAAQTLGRLLSTNLQTSYWNTILNSELWGLKQEISDILPALQLSYIYLPFHLKRCFSFCAVYPKDYKFDKSILSEIWVAEGFVKREGAIPILDTGCQYFEDLVSRSFFQKVRGTYVIHDLMHDMAQLVSKHECFTIKDLSDFRKVPRNVRHLMILDSRNFDCSNLLSLCEHTKLRTLLCVKSLSNKTLASVMDRWCSELRHMRVLSCASLKEIPMSIGNLKHLRYFRISKECPFNCLPPEICWLYKLQFLYATKCELEILPSDFSKLINLLTYESVGFVYHRMQKLRISPGCLPIRFMKNMNQFCGDLEITNLEALSKDLAVEIDLKKKKDLRRLTLNWFGSSREHDEVLLQALQPPSNLKYLKVAYYGGESLPCWCNNNVSIPVFPSLTDLEIFSCAKLSSLDHFLQADYMPALERISITECKMVAALPAERFGKFCCLEDLTVSNCPTLFNNSGSLSVPTLKNLKLRNSGILVSNIECCSLVSLSFQCVDVTSIPIQLLSGNLSAPTLKNLELRNSGILVSNIECFSLVSLSFQCVDVTSIPIQLLSGNLPSLQKLDINSCESLTFIGESYPLNGAFSSLTVLLIRYCHKLATLDDLLKKEYIPAIERIKIYACGELLSLPGERFGSFTCLTDLSISDCPKLNWQSGFVLPSYLRELSLHNCGDFSAWFPSCLGNLTCLVALTMISCAGISSFPNQMWRSNLASLKELRIADCPDLVSIGAAKSISKIKAVHIYGCPKLTKVKQPLFKGPGWRSY